MKVVFLDRDGVINVEKHMVFEKKEYELIPGSAEAIKLLNEAGYKVVVITNQPVIACGFASENVVNDILNYMKELLHKKGAFVDAVYYCPHHPTKGNNPEFTKECVCRKPKSGMLLQAQKDLGIEKFNESYVVGDRISDIKAGQAVGCVGILVETGYGSRDLGNC